MKMKKLMLACTFVLVGTFANASTCTQNCINGANAAVAQQNLSVSTPAGLALWSATFQACDAGCPIQ